MDQDVGRKYHATVSTRGRLTLVCYISEHRVAVWAVVSSWSMSDVAVNWLFAVSEITK